GLRADQGGEPWAAVELVLLQHGHAERDGVDRRRRDLARAERFLGRLGGEDDRVGVRQAALPLAERSAPVGAVGDVSVREPHGILRRTSVAGAPIASRYNSRVLRHTYLHVPGVGEKRERDLWRRGFTDWEAFRDGHPAGAWRELILTHLDPAHAARALPRREA